MGLMDMFKSSENKQLKELVNELEKMLSPDQQYAEQLKQTITEREMKIKELDETIQSKYRDIQTAEKAVQQSLSNLNVVNREIDKKKSLSLSLDDQLLFESFGLYKPTYSFVKSEEYKIRFIKNEKMIIKENCAL